MLEYSKKKRHARAVGPPILQNGGEVSPARRTCVMRVACGTLEAWRDRIARLKSNWKAKGPRQRHPSLVKLLKHPQRKEMEQMIPVTLARQT